MTAQHFDKTWLPKFKKNLNRLAEQFPEFNNKTVIITKSLIDYIHKKSVTAHASLVEIEKTINKSS